jgi:uncharacterized membrane protein
LARPRAESLTTAEMEIAAQILRLLHIAAGVTALLTFSVPLFTRKGGVAHRRVGLVYVYAMFAAALTAVLITQIRLMQRTPDRWTASLFLAYVALLSFSAAFYGVRVLAQKKRKDAHANAIDLSVPVILVVASIVMSAYGVVVHDRLATFFPLIGFLVAIPEIRTLRAAPTEERGWLAEHLGAMLISCIATLTAFAVTNAAHFFHNGRQLAVWFFPTIVGTPLILFFRRKYVPTIPKKITTS